MITVSHDNQVIGLPRSNSKCAIALALEDLGFELINVTGLHFWTAYKEGSAYRGTLPDIAQSFIQMNDKARSVSVPFTFESDMTICIGSGL